MRLRTQLILIILPLVILPLAWIGWLVFNQLLEKINQTADQEMNSAIARIETSLLQLENNAKNNIRLFSSSRVFQKYIESDDEDDRYLMQQPLLLKRFSEYQATYPEYYEIRFITPGGFVDTRTTSNKTNQTNLENGEAKYLPALTKKNALSIKYALDPHTDNFALYVYQSLFTIDRTVDPDTIDRSANPEFWESKHRGYLSLTVDIQKNVQNIRSSGSGDTVGLILLDEQNQIVAAADSLKPIVGHAKNLFSLTNEAWSLSVARQEFRVIGKKITQGLNLFALLPSSSINKQVGHLQQQIFLVTLFSIIVTLSVIFYILNRGLVKPINKLIAATGEIGRGNLQPQIQVDSNNEMGALSDAILKMSESLAQSQQKIHHIAYHDQLTGLPNRRMMKKEIERALMYANHHHTIGALFFLDIDNFKNVNDSLGHEVGDELLTAFSDCLKIVLRGEDRIFDEMVCRFGGDEFVILLENLSAPTDAALVANRIIETLQTPLIVSVGEQFVSTSIGIALFPDDSRDSDELMRKADLAMYYAKENGKNNSQYFSLEMNEKLQRRNEIELNLRHAIVQHELYLRYQVQVDLHSNKLVGVEALLGWHSKSLGEVPTREFIAIAEETNQINEIGNWVLEQGIAQAKEWVDSGIQDLKVAINISSKQFKYMDIEGHIARYMKKYQLPSNLLEIELTESTLVSNLDKCCQNLKDINARGVEISLDCFGSGYSSLSYLQQFPLTQIKIDSSFVEDIHTNEDSKVIVSAIIALGHSLNLLVLASGVGLPEQRQILTDLGCDRIQGPLCSEPLDKDQLLAFVKQHNG